MPNENINVTVTFRHTESTSALKSYAIDKLSHCLRKYLNNRGDIQADVQVILSVEKRDHVAEAIIRAKPFDVTGKAATGDLYSAIDKVVDTVDAQLRKQKERYTDHKH